MLVPSLYISRNPARPWNLGRAAAYGAALGAAAAMFKTLGPLRTPDAGIQSLAGALAAGLPEIAAAAVAFACLCAGAALLRNVLARRLIGPDRTGRNPD